MNWLDEVKWDADGLVPVIAQERGSDDVLMFAFMNREALARTARLGEAVYWSRSRQRLWHKGEESRPRAEGARDAARLRQRRGAAGGRRSSATSRASPATPAAIAASSSRFEDGAWQAVEPVLKDPEHIYK